MTTACINRLQIYKFRYVCSIAVIVSAADLSLKVGTLEMSCGHRIDITELTKDEILELDGGICPECGTSATGDALADNVVIEETFSFI